MFGFGKIKLLFFGMLVASPAIAAWKFRSSAAVEPSRSAQLVAQQRPIAEPVSRVPVQVITSGSAPEWIYVQVGTDAVPEPGAVSLVAVFSLLLAFRRQRN